MSIDIGCDECKKGISDGDQVYCQDCWSDKEKELESKIQEKDREIEGCEDDLQNAYKDSERMRLEIESKDSEINHLQTQIRDLEGREYP